MGLGDMTEKASDAGIDKAGEAADSKTGGKAGDKIDKGQDMADKKVGE